MNLLRCSPPRLRQAKTRKPNFENDALELAVIAQGLAKAAELLAGQFTLVITNVPYLKRRQAGRCA